MKSFQLFSELEAHLDVGDHCVEAERQSETIRFVEIGWRDLPQQSTSLKMNLANLSTRVKVNRRPPRAVLLWAGL